ncbi:MAG TPA: PHB depolymerase family esterase [Rudaea sp.]|jgi:pimeloyl-ACP methyl ester carboxylesterase
MEVWTLRLLLTGILVFPAASIAAADSAAPPGLQKNVRFAEYSPLSRASELERRLFSPLQALRANEDIAQSGHEVREQSIDLAQEEFTVYVPPAMPGNGYALLVFVMPWASPALPWRRTEGLDKHGMIFVMAARSGNDANVLDRREPLALLAAHNIMLRYRIDPARVYVGGLSGGSRVAMRLALAYPDLFHGALLNAGSDPIGTAQIRLPPADLMHQFQEASRLVYLTGKDDVLNLDLDMHSRDSMQDWCVFDVSTLTIAWTGHEVVNAVAFRRGVDALEAHDRPSPEKLASCRRRYRQELDEKLHEVELLQAGDKMDQAAALLDAIDQRFGGLAAPRSLELAQPHDR